MITARRALPICMLAILVIGTPSSVSAVAEGETPLFGDHVKMHFRLQHMTGDITTVLGIVDEAEGLIMFAYTRDNRLFVTDGQVDGEDRPHLALPGSVGSTWHRLDVVLHGDTYTLHVDQVHTIEARTFTNATAGPYVPDPRPIYGPYPDEVDWALHRVDDWAMQYDETFTRPSSTWESIGAPGAVVIAPECPGHYSVGCAQVPAPGPGVAYLRAPTEGLAGVYWAESALAVGNNLNIPAGQVALAGVSGPAAYPDVQWAIVIDRPLLAVDADGTLARPNQYAFFLVDGEGHRTLLSPFFVDTKYHSVKFKVDEPGEMLTIRFDDGPMRSFPLDLGTSTYVAAGHLDPLLPGRGTAYYDEMALYKETLQ